MVICMRARYYDPSIGQFVTNDPLGLGGGDTITPAAKKVIYQPEARVRDPVRFPRWRVGLICSSMRNFLAGVIILDATLVTTRSTISTQLADRLATSELHASTGSDQFTILVRYTRIRQSERTF